MSQPLPGQENRGEPEQRPDQGQQLPPLPPPPPQPYGRHFGYDPRTMYPTAPPEQRPPVGAPRVAGSRRTQGGILGTLGALLIAVIGYGKYLLIALKAVPILTTAASLLISFGLYAAFAGPTFAAALVIMILVHEMGHVIEIQRQGLRATAPIFIPFVGAAIFQQQHPQDALRQAEIGIAGPVAGTVGATAAYVLYGVTGWDFFAIAAALGFFLNLLNLIPAGMLDGGWVLAPVSKWFQVAGLALMGLLVLFQLVSPILLFIVVLGIPTVIARFRYADSPYFTSVSTAGRWAMGIAWLALTVYLAFALVLSQQQLEPLVAGR